MWSRTVDGILDHPVPLLVLVALLTAFLGYHAADVGTDHRAGNFTDAASQVNQDYERAKDLFGSSATLLYVVVADVDPLDAEVLGQLDRLTEAVGGLEGVDYALSLANVPTLRRAGSGLEPVPLYDPALPDSALRARYEAQPFLDGLLLAEDGEATMLLASFDPVFNNTRERVGAVREIERLAAETLPDQATVALAGFPYLRTEYAQRVSREAPLFTGLALAISLLFLFLTFRSIRAVVLPTVVVLLGIAWTIGLLALFDYRINIVTAMLPALIVIIGMATTIHLTTTFYDQFGRLGDRREALQETMHTAGVTTFLACLTTAIGFAVLVFSGSGLLVTFGLFAAVGIMLLWGLAITLIPTVFLRMRPPVKGRKRIATSGAFERWFDRLAVLAQQRAGLVLGAFGALALVGIVGATQVSDDIFVFSDFYEDDPLRQNLAVFEEHFGGVLPMEIIVAAEREGAFRSPSRVRQVDTFAQRLESIDEVGQVLTAASLVKLSTQAYFGGRPEAYRFPSTYELPFVQGALTSLARNEGGAFDNLPAFVDSSFQYARVFVGVEDIGTTRMNALADSVRGLASAQFDAESFDVLVTGTAVRSTRSGESLVKNLVVSLAVALLLISALMAALFRTVRLTLISLAPSVVPLLLVGGAMGFVGITLKPSTALIFPLAFGIAVDNTIHFLAKYRLLRGVGLTSPTAVRLTLRETGKALLFTSLVLMAGFLVFTFSGFGGTVNMGALTALTLLIALVANLVLLPALLYAFVPHTEEEADAHPAFEGAAPAPGTV